MRGPRCTYPHRVVWVCNWPVEVPCQQRPGIAQRYLLDDEDRCASHQRRGTCWWCGEPCDGMVCSEECNRAASNHVMYGAAACGGKE